MERRGAQLCAGVVTLLLLAAGVGGCTTAPSDTAVVSLPALSFLPEMGDAQAKTERVVGQSVWAVTEPSDATGGGAAPVLGSAIAVAPDRLLVSCDAAIGQDRVGIERRSARRTVGIVSRGPRGRICELRVTDVRLDPVAGYRSFATLEAGDPIMAVVSSDSRSFRLLRGAVTAKGDSGDPFLETNLTLPPATRSAAFFDDQGRFVGFGSSGAFADAVAVVIPVPVEQAS
ncbi:MAG: hypothetical protein U1E45_24915 [Geminicoccaceae bacterium]